MRDRRPFMSHEARGLLLRSTARTRTSIVCSLLGHDYDTRLPRSSLNAHNSDRKIDTIGNDYQILMLNMFLTFTFLI